MKKKIAILGSTGSIGITTLKIVSENKNIFKVNLLSTNKNIKILKKQTKQFDVKNVIIHDINEFNKNKHYFKKKRINLFQNITDYKKKNKNKFDYVMSAIIGLDGLEPTLGVIDCTKKIAIANKESIICGWSIIKKRLKKYNTEFIPIDSEHFSIFELIKHEKYSFIEKIFITASGGPFINLPLKNFSKVKPKHALKHPSWKMGKKISIDSATLMNKVFEVIEARNIFDLSFKQISILTHPNSYIHSMVKFDNGLIKILAHEPNMKIPIYNSFSKFIKKGIASKELDLKILNNLKLKKIDKKKFISIKLLKDLPNYTSLFETVLITINDFLVQKFLENRINFKKLIFLINKISNSKELQKFKRIKPKNLKDIYRLRDYVSSKMNSLAI